MGQGKAFSVATEEEEKLEITENNKIALCALCDLCGNRLETPSKRTPAVTRRGPRLVDSILLVRQLSFVRSRGLRAPVGRSAQANVIGTLQPIRLAQVFITIDNL